MHHALKRAEFFLSLEPQAHPNRAWKRVQVAATSEAEYQVLLSISQHGASSLSTQFSIAGIAKDMAALVTDLLSEGMEKGEVYLFCELYGQALEQALSLWQTLSQEKAQVLLNSPAMSLKAPWDVTEWLALLPQDVQEMVQVCGLDIRLERTQVSIYDGHTHYSVEGTISLPFLDGAIREAMAVSKRASL